MSFSLSIYQCLSVYDFLSIYLSNYLYLLTHQYIYSCLALTCSHFHTATNPNHSLTRTLSLSLTTSLPLSLPLGTSVESVWWGVRDCGYKDMNIWHRFTCMCIWALPVYDVGVFMGVSMPSIHTLRPTPCPACIRFTKCVRFDDLIFLSPGQPPRHFGYGRLG